MELRPSKLVEVSLHCSICKASDGRLDPCPCGTLAHVECFGDVGCPTIGCVKSKRGASRTVEQRFDYRPATQQPRIVPTGQWPVVASTSFVSSAFTAFGSDSIGSAINYGGLLASSSSSAPTWYNNFRARTFNNFRAFTAQDVNREVERRTPETNDFAERPEAGHMDAHGEQFCRRGVRQCPKSRSR